MLTYEFPNLSELTDENLEALASAIETELQNRRETGAFTFEFTAVGTITRDAYPFVATLTGIESNGRFTREFKEFEYTYDEQGVKVEGLYTAEHGEILEIRGTGAREFYVVVEGQRKLIGYFASSRLKLKIKQYLRGELPLESLIPSERVRTAEGDGVDEEETARA